MKASEQLNATCGSETLENWVETVRKQVRSLRFGLVQVVVHNGRVVQIEKTEKIRFDQVNANSFTADQNSGGSK
jgi:hypothetical protein